MIYSNSQRDPENVRIVMIVIVLDWDFTCLSFWVAVATVSEGQFTVSLLKSQGFFYLFLTFFDDACIVEKNMWRVPSDKVGAARRSSARADPIPPAPQSSCLLACRRHLTFRA
jgi:hypothetical protein